jgi:hypothetical protein
MSDFPKVTSTARIGELEEGDFVVLFGGVKRPIVRFEGYEDGTVVVVYSDGAGGVKSLRALYPHDEIPAVRLAAYAPDASPPTGSGLVEEEPDISPEGAPAAMLTPDSLLPLFAGDALTDLELHERHRDQMVDAGLPFETVYAIQRQRKALEKAGRVEQVAEQRDAATGATAPVYAVKDADVALRLGEDYAPEPPL